MSQYRSLIARYAGGKLVAFDAQAGRWEVRLEGGSSLRVYMCVYM